MDLIERYVYAVVRYLPEKQREEIAAEIRALIADMAEKYPDEPEETKIKKVLEELGSPAKLADSYRGKERYLIGPGNFTRYIFVLKIVLAAVLLSVTIASAVNGVFITDGNVGKFFGNYFSDVFEGLLQGFAWVTIVFAIAEYKGYEPIKNHWSIETLPLLPNKKAMISKSGIVVGIVFITIFTMILYFFPGIIALYINTGSGAPHTIPLFNLDAWDNFRYLIIAFFIVGIIRELIKLFYGAWNLELAVYYSILTIISMVIFILLFVNNSIWNPNFVNELIQYTDIRVTNGWNTADTASFAIKVIIAVNLIDIAAGMFKGIRYNNYREYKNSVMFKK